MKKILSIQSLDTDLATLLLRLVFGGLFMYHGYTKYLAFDQYSTMFPDMIGIGSKFTFTLVTLAELGCGFLVLIGLFTRLAVLPILAVMIGAFFVAHANDPFQGKELVFTFLLLCFAIFVAGSGKYSVDAMIGKN